MKKKFLALVLTLAMVLSLVPVTALATDGTPDTASGGVVYGHYTNTGEWESGKPENAIPDSLKDKVTVNKIAEKVAGQDNQYDVTLTVQMKHKTEEVQPGAAATVLVIDTSGSMDYCTDPTHTHKKDKYGNRCGTWNGRTSRLSVAKTAAINFLKSYSGFSDSAFTGNGSLKNGVSDKNLNRYVSLVTFDDSASVQTWGKRNDEKSWIDVSTKDGYKKLLDAINDIEAGGGTNLDAALRLATTQMQSGSIAQIDQSKRNVIALTDGVPTYYVSIGTGWFGTDENVSQHGNYGCPDTNVATTRSADALKADGTAVYTVCFGAANDICWTKDSVHVEHTFKDDEKHTTDGPKVGKFLEDNIATLSTSEKKYAYNADDAENLYKAFAAITQTITDGLNEGVVTDGLPEGVMPVEGSGFATTWTLDSSSVTPTTSNGYNIYTYTKTYRVNVDPATAKTVPDNGVNYAPLNTPTTLTVQHNGSPVVIHFPIPAGKVTYSLTDFEKALVTNQNKPTDFDIPAGVTIPDTKDSTVTVGENGVTLLYKITVKGDKGAKFIVTDDGATLVPPTDNSITFNQEGSTFSGTVGTTGETVFYVSKHFDVTTGMTSVSNTATIDPGDNAKGPADDKKTKTVTTTVTEAKPQTYTVIFNANGGAWSSGVAGYEMQQDTETSTYVAAQKSNLTKEDAFSLLDGTGLSQDGKRFVGWGATRTQSNQYLLSQLSTVGQLVNVMKNASLLTSDNTITLYAIWEDVSADQCTYTIHQHFMKDADNEDGAINYYTTSQVASAGTSISSLIPNELINTSTDYNFNGSKYLYEAAKIGTDSYTGQETLQAGNTEIHLYYYLDSLTDADKDGTSTDKDSLTDGDGIPDYKQILIQYQVYQEGNGLVTPEFEVVTVKDNKELTAIHGSSVKKAGTGYTFVTWTGQNVAVTEKTVGDIIKETSAEKLKKEKCDLSKDTFEQGKSYTYTAIFLEDKVGEKDKDGNDKGDGIPDAWQYKVTFKVLNGKWNDQTSADVVAYVTNKKDDTTCAKGTEGSKATLDGVTIPVAGSQPDSGYKASGNWNTTPSATTVINKEDTVFTYTYDKKSGGSGGSGGSHKPTVTIPDDVPTGLNGKDHYAYVVGYPDGMVYPQKNITRAEVATIFFRLLKDETREANMTKSNGYNDMKDGAWYTCAVSTLSKMGIIKGYEDGSFKPDASISRAEFAAIAARFDPDGDKTPATFSDVSSHWAKDEISIAANHGWIKGYEDGSFKPDQKITRAETMTLVNRVLKRLPETKDDLHKDMKTWPDNQNESAWFYLAVQEATNSHYQKLKKDGTHETWESMRETRDWAALEK